MNTYTHKPIDFTLDKPFSEDWVFYMNSGDGCYFGGDFLYCWQWAKQCMPFDHEVEERLNELFILHQLKTQGWYKCPWGNRVYNEILYVYTDGKFKPRYDRECLPMFLHRVNTRKR